MSIFRYKNKKRVVPDIDPSLQALKEVLAQTEKREKEMVRKIDDTLQDARRYTAAVSELQIQRTALLAQILKIEAGYDILTDEDAKSEEEIIQEQNEAASEHHQRAQHVDNTMLQSHSQQLHDGHDINIAKGSQHQTRPLSDSGPASSSLGCEQQIRMMPPADQRPTSTLHTEKPVNPVPSSSTAAHNGRDVPKPCVVS